MTSTYASTTERIALTPDFPGTVYTAGWTPRPHLQSPDLRPPTEEHATLAELIRRAEERHQDDMAAEPVALAEVMPQPDGRPKRYRSRYRSRHRMPSRWARDAVLYGSGMLSAAVLFLAGAHILAAFR